MAEPSTTAVAAVVSAVGGVSVTMFGITPQSFFAALAASALAAAVVPAKYTGPWGWVLGVIGWFLTIIVAAIFAHGIQAAAGLSSAVENALAAALGYAGPFVWKSKIEGALDNIVARFKG